MKVSEALGGGGGVRDNEKVGQWIRAPSGMGWLWKSVCYKKWAGKSRDRIPEIGITGGAQRGGYRYL